MADSIVNLGRYQVIEHIATGGMGAVYKAKDKKLNRLVALKSLITTEGLESSTYEATLREARTLAMLEHPHILKVYDVVNENNQIWLVSEWVEGRQISDFTMPFNLPIALGIMIRLVEAIHYVHEQKILHRDLKPQNIMVTHTGRVVIIDFGVAFLPGSTGKTIAGTFRYLDPEILAGKNASPSSDIFSLGLIFLEMLTGETVLPDLSPIPLYQYVESDLENRVAALCDGLYPPIIDIINDMLLDEKSTSIDLRKVAKRLNGLFYEWNKEAPEAVIKQALEKNSEGSQALTAALLDEAQVKIDDPNLDLRDKARWLSFSQNCQETQGQSGLHSRLASRSRPSQTVIRTANKKARSANLWLVALVTALVLVAGVGLNFYFVKPASVKGTPGVLPEVEKRDSLQTDERTSQETVVTDSSPKTTVPIEARAETPEAQSSKSPSPKIAANKGPKHKQVEVRIAANAWADIAINGEAKGRLPTAKPFLLKPGKHLIKLTSPFVKTWEKTITIPDKSKENLFVKLELIKDMEKEVNKN